MRFLISFLFLLLIKYSFGNTTLEEIHKLAIPRDFLNKINKILKIEADQGNTLCAGQLSDYFKALQALQPWALQMFDASGKIPSGVLEGNIDMGSFDECLKVEEPVNRKITGQYCLAELDLDISIAQHIKAVQILKSAITRSQESGVKTKLAICVPEVCSANELSSIFKRFGLNISFAKENCQSKKTQPTLDSAAVATIALFGTILVLMLISTLYDVYYFYLQRDAAQPVLTSFSVFSNGRKLMSTSKNPDVIKCMNGIRVLSIMWVVVGHTYVMQVFYPLKNLLFAIEWISDVGNMFIMGATVSVDTFFLMSGLLLMYSFLVYKRKGKKFNILLFYIHRYLRLTPALAAVVLFHLSLLKYMGSGPMWPSTLASIVTGCEKSWWKTLLYIQNYGTISSTCIQQAWYLSADMHLYLLSPILLLPMVVWPKITLIGTGVLTILSMISCFVIGWMYELNGQILGNSDPTDTLEFFTKYYMTTHTRAAVWLIGVVYGYLAFKVNDKNCKLLFHKVVVSTFWVLSLAVLCTCVFAGHDLIFQTKVDKLENSLYLALVRPSWGIAVGWIIFACFKGYGGPVNWFLSLPMFEILSKLSYSLYLVHFTIMYVQAGQIRSPQVLSNFNELYKFWSDFGFSLIISLILYLAIEQPVSLIQQHLLGVKQGNNKKGEQRVEDSINNISKGNDAKQP